MTTRPTYRSRNKTNIVLDTDTDEANQLGKYVFLRVQIDGKTCEIQYLSYCGDYQGDGVLQKTEKTLNLL